MNTCKVPVFTVQVEIRWLFGQTVCSGTQPDGFTSSSSFFSLFVYNPDRFSNRPIFAGEESAAAFLQPRLFVEYFLLFLSSRCVSAAWFPDQRSRRDPSALINAEWECASHLTDSSTV